MIFPRLEDLVKLAPARKVLPVTSAVLADTETPVSVWLKLFAAEKYSFLLESVSGTETVARYSFIGGDPFLTFRSNAQNWRIDGVRPETGTGAPLDKLRELIARYRSEPVPGMPRFTGGAVGFFSYDSVRLRERIPDKNPGDSLLDEVFFGFYRDVVIFDNREHRLLLVTNILTDDSPSLEQAYRDACSRLGTLEDKMAVRLASSHISVRPTGELQSNFSRDEYEIAVDKCKEYIKAGDIFQVVLSQRFSMKVDARPFDLYRILRTINPSPYMYYLSCDQTSVIGASPEMLVRVENGKAETRPIAGSSRRGKTEAEDEQLSGRLKKDAKEVAEHIMLVDLGRNDIGRVSEYGSVKVEEMMHIEKYSHIMHLVTNVHGTLKKSCDALDALFACFPAGTLSGAPKIRAMEIIDELEPVRRGLYGGALGYIDFSGNLDSCIVIRTIIYRDGVAHIQAGAGIVADSVPSREYDETVNKAGALFAAIKEAGMICGK
jgi:anthranilate synthase component 1